MNKLHVEITYEKWRIAYIVLNNEGTDHMIIYFCPIWVKLAKQQL